MFSVTNSAGLFGMNAFPVTVEAETLRGHTQFDISGLPDASVKEARDRVRSAVTSVNLKFPKGRVLMNLAPADIKKSGTSFDLAIFVALMQAMEILPARMPERIFLGELGLNGTLHGIRGVMTMVMMAKSNGFREVYVPYENVREAAVIDGIAVYGIRNVGELLMHLRGEHTIQPAPVSEAVSVRRLESVLDFCDVRGQVKARSAVELAAAGGHNILLIGAPGSGKSMLANRIPTILPEMTRAEILETTNVYSVAGMLPAENPLMTERPFRAPHHTVSAAGLVGGGSIPAPGEISLAHNGVLFLDELPEFDRSTLEILRQPMESHEVVISRAAGTAVYPCNFMLVAAMNPCPCGYYGSTHKKCTCSQRQVQNYLGRVSGPLLDRFDLRVDVDPVVSEDLASPDKAESSEKIRERIQSARDMQKQRFAGTSVYSNAMIPDNLLREFCQMASDAEILLRQIHDRYGMSARTYSRIQRVARSAADLHGHEKIERIDLAAAVQFRGFDSKYLK